MTPEVLQSMLEASKHFVPIIDLHKAGGRKIADFLQVEACCITCGAAAGLAISSAAALTRGDLAKVLQLPDTTRMPNEGLVLKAHRILYDQAVRLSGACLKEIGVTSYADIHQIEAAITPQVAFFLYVSEAEHMRGSVSLEEIVPIMKKYNITIIVDAAAEIPPKSNIHKYLDMGADMVVFSGGKELRGPQSTGLILGSKYWIEACNENCCPNHGIGRSMKIDKESIAGIVKAVEIFAKKDYDIQMGLWEQMIDTIVERLKEAPNTLVRKGFPMETGVQPACLRRAFIKP